MKWVSYTRSISSRIGEENPSNTIAEQNERIARYLKKLGCNVSEKYSDRKRTAEATEGFDKLVQDGMARKFDAVVVDSIFRCGRTLPFAIEALQRTFYPLGIQFAVVEDACGMKERYEGIDGLKAYLFGNGLLASAPRYYHAVCSLHRSCG